MNENSSFRVFCKISKARILAITMSIALAMFITTTSNVLADPGASLDVAGTFTDIDTGNVYNLDFEANEINVGVGHTFLHLDGPALSVCGVHGPAADPSTFSFNDIQCGNANRMSVAINGCTAKVELHGYSHSDHPFVTYIGSTTIDLTVRKRKKESRWFIKISIFTPKKKIELRGIVDGLISMSSCP